MKTVLSSSRTSSLVPLTEICGVGVGVSVRVGDGVGVNGLAASVCFASARAVLARDVSTPGGLTTGWGAFPLQPLAINDIKDKMAME
jgi:hypothetical protein